MNKNSNLHKAKNKKNDEFYTEYQDIELEINSHSPTFFENKTILCNCDDVKFSQFFVFFKNNFIKMKLKKVIFSHLSDNNDTTVTEIIKKNDLHSIDILSYKRFDNGDFRNTYSLELLKQADLVITNPPFSLFREYIAMLIKHNKEFLIVGSLNAVTYKDVFFYIKNENVFLGNNCPKTFITVDGKKQSFGNICWYTNFSSSIEKASLPLSISYFENKNKYQYYDNYDAIEVSKLKDIPYDFDGVMGVPITFLLKHNPKQFRIVGETSGRFDFECHPTKKYIKPIQYDQEGNKSNGSKVNTRSCLKIEDGKENHRIYYSADNIDYDIKPVYSRVLIKKIIKN